ncbi:hypothetical protein EDD29_4551 [Actinocorallia herbida]|uniref:Uncharacterized protein n=1 Tax=Actinocorallia herbida TaxID=58109 RepID=A0A3N1D0A9_9ACTN|nr:hypothetical protein EDD29_4551 [Actinocorallia herbida]
MAVRHTATTPPEVYQATGRALRLLIQGSLFDYTKLA